MKYMCAGNAVFLWTRYDGWKCGVCGLEVNMFPEWCLIVISAKMTELPVPVVSHLSDSLSV